MSSGRVDAATAYALAGVAACVALPYHGLRFGDGLELAAVASHFGVAHPPGYPVYTLLGGLAMRLAPGVEPYLAMLMMSRLFAAALVVGVLVLTRGVLVRLLPNEADVTPDVAGAAALILAVSALLRPGLHVVEVYTMLSALLAAVAWCCWRSLDGGGCRWAVAAWALLGVAAGHHLTALALAPLAVMAVLRGRHWSALPAVVAGWVVAPILLWWRAGAGGQGIRWGGIDSLGSLVGHLRGGEYGGQRLLQSMPGRWFTPAEYIQFAMGRVAMLLEALGSLIVGVGATSIVVGVVGVVLMGFGATRLWRAGGALRAMGAGLMAALALQVGFVLVYNIADISDYILPMTVSTLPPLAAGTLLGARALFRRLDFAAEKTALALRILGMTGVLLAALGGMHAGHVDNAGPAEAWGERLFAELPEGAALLTGGDGDIYRSWYEQFARGQRRDVLVVGGNFLRFPWFAATLNPADPRSALVGFAPGPPPDFATHMANLRRLVLDPLLADGSPVYTTITQPMEVMELGRHYRVRPVARLLTDEELLRLARTTEIMLAAPILYQITSTPEPAP